MTYVLLYVNTKRGGWQENHIKYENREVFKKYLSKCYSHKEHYFKEISEVQAKEIEAKGFHFRLVSK